MSAPQSNERSWMMMQETLQHLKEKAVERLRTNAPSPYLLIAEHAGNQIPAPWRNLGLDPAFMHTHFAVDLGIDALTRRLSELLAAPAVIGRYSRLFLDFNRPENEWDFVRPDLGGIPVPGNIDLSQEDIDLRRRIAWQPLEDAIEETSARASALVSIHSFTPIMGGNRRDVDIGALWREPSDFVERALRYLHVDGNAAGFRIGDNAPYDWRGVTAYTLVRHGIDKRLPCFYLEVSNAVLADSEKFEQASKVIADVLAKVSSELWPTTDADAKTEAQA